MMKQVPDKFKKLTIVIPPLSDVGMIAACPGIGPLKPNVSKLGKHRSS
jgi:hypothetical protein